jgi:hypothetical protein
VHREIKENLATTNVSSAELNALQRQQWADVSRGRELVRQAGIVEANLVQGLKSRNERLWNGRLWRAQSRQEKFNIHRSMGSTSIP